MESIVVVFPSWGAEGFYAVETAAWPVLVVEVAAAVVVGVVQQGPS